MEQGDSTKMDKIAYEVIMVILAVIAVILAIIDISTSTGLNEWQLILDNVILVIFVADYFIRLFSAKNKKIFIRENIFDLIAIIPINSAFRAFRFVRLIRILKLVKLVKVFAYIMRLFKRTKKFFDTNGFKYVVALTLFSIFISSFLIHFAEGMSYQDGLWWSFVTATTVGYGDISPKTSFGRLIAVVLMIMGIGLIGSLTSTITSYFINNKKETSFKNEIIENIKSKLDCVFRTDSATLSVK